MSLYHYGKMEHELKQRLVPESWVSPNVRKRIFDFLPMNTLLAHADFDKWKTLPIVHWDKFPTNESDNKPIRHDFINECASGSWIKENWDKILPKGALIKELRDIVGTYLMDMEMDIIISIPLREIISIEYNYLLRCGNHWYIRCLYGFEDGGEFQFFTSSDTSSDIAVSGHFPLYPEYYGCSSVGIRNPVDLNRRFLVRLSMEIRDNPTNKYQQWRTCVWHRDCSRLFDSKEETDQFIKDTNGRYTVFRTGIGTIGIYHHAVM